MALVKLKDVVMRVKDKVDRDTADLDFYIGGEHFDYAEICISRRGVIQGSTIGPAFHMRFQPGDVLLMSRNPHLRKAGVVDFEGICSDVSYVCRTKDENVLLQRYLPFIFQTDHFWDFAESNKKGSTNFFLNWSDFEKYEFNLPPIEIQRELTELLWAAENTKLAYVDLLRQTDELVKSQFIEMFGDIKEHIKLPLVEFGSIIEIGPQNGLYKSSKFYRLDQSGTPIVRVDSFYDGRVTDYSTLKRLDCSPEEISTYGLKDGDLVFNRVNGSVEHVGKCALISGLREETVFESNMMRVRTDPSKVDIGFLSTYLCSDIVRNQIKEKARVANQASVNQRDIRSILIPLPDIELQREYATFVRQSDKSKFELKQAIERVTNLMKSLMQQDFAN